MAGAGFKTWVDGDILTAADVNTYLMEQAVMVFATSTARTTALAAPSEGMVTFLKDTNALQYYDGSAWQPLVDQDVIAAKGDLIVGTGDDTVAALSVGTNGHVLTADSTTATGLKWAAGGGGKVLQVVSTVKSDTFTTTSTTFTDITDVSVSITPTLNTSKILVLSTITGMGTNGTAAALLRLLRDSTVIGAGTTAGSRSSGFSMLPITPANATLGQGTVIFLDSPATTSALTYKIQIKYNGLSGSAYVNRAQDDTDSSDRLRSISTITVLEIGA